MRKVFIETKNAKRATAAVMALQKSVLERFLLIFGDSGLGKSEFGMWLINYLSLDAIFIRVVKVMTTRWLLEELVCAMGLEPAWRTKDLFDQAKEALVGTNRLVIFDEIDYLTHDSKVIETIRDLGDLTNAPFVFIGMEAADKKLRRHRPLWRRFSQIVRFEPMDREDVSLVLRGVCEVEVDETTIDTVFETQGLTLSLIYRFAQKIEGIARSRGLKIVTADDLLNRSTAKESHGTKANSRIARLSA
jgi:DNA transposition AAA+ family ATPase